MTVQDSNKARALLRLHEINKRLMPKFERCTGISQSRLEVIQAIYKVEEISQKELQQIVNIDHAAVTRHLKQLEEQGMVTRRKSPEDNRVTFVKMTEQGRTRVLTYCEERKYFTDQLFSGLTEEECLQLDNTLQHIQQNIESIQKREI
ncbi:MarR family winged helix-turn-helix transcriptional regulator [Alkalicoccobacillus murimartini]|uniref:DNA-binding MarR family transcriptional regulator n=1 Tax=Alkalicoccobacillus murimartini TaxID=171685 RepID=A0ABT9YMA3_9BACI|nr:MarR family transcriptional regulator [Alkalicoccobacillus murimartini]MDQ0208723.1 DNA-binding MarR family transcriptional regulator [Alkalicoccobacillus murimartini]